jgi:chromate transport protein ChrA
MNDLFATIYEALFGLYDSQFSLIFDTLYDYGGYNLLGLTFIAVPLIMFASFYFLWKYPYGKIWHWLLWLLIAFLITGAISWGISNNEIFLSDNQSLIDALADPESGYEQHANTLPLLYALFNGLLSVAVGLIFSLILKQFSKIQIHLPF